MALALDPARIVAPLSPEAPCGPDLDEAGDLDFLNGVSQVESLMPAAFFTRDAEGRQVPFDRGGIDVKRETGTLLGLLDRSRDLRVLTLLGRLAMLDRDLPGFAAVLAAVAGLLEARWEAVHPRGDGADYELRGAVLQSLDDVPTVILPLQHVALFQSRRYGPITFRSVMIADREVPGREDEPAPDRGMILQARAEAPAEEVRAVAEAAGRIVDEAARIGALTAQRGGQAGAIRLERLESLAARIRELLADRDAEAGPEAVGPETAQPGESPAAARAPGGAIATAAEAAAALSAVALYLRGNEPSSPAEVLVRQAQMLLGKSFIEVMRILMPDQAGEAAVVMGANRSLRLTFEQLAAVPDAVEDTPEAAWDDPAEGDGVEGDTSDADTAEGEAAPEAPPARRFRAATRAEAVALLREIGGFFRTHEPSSPIPLLLDKAAAMADRDFLAILRDVMPEPEAG
ncbi:type VI secretion system ImpA family N-terminal domain-containing protein [Methylobacterium sp. NEAU 140]|uniref:type VI secretion system protein TssA n=1 Tax=Methylobacterium sp. NEAU 140 TaxID=3064945 RepID=UPI0027373040|nr:type VI secretion system ImpA family N-terminal domain-containing protein [Methylobacterium sp. NEAU 140]MDP4024927.1 type VI secretion system ImpA family N-terminal domain-containing protein [Methylobacterium sp. NEAU 140]